MKETLIEFSRILISLGLGAFGLEWYKNWKNKKKDALEVTSAYIQGQTMEVQFRADLNKLVDQTVAPLKHKIQELEQTVVTNAIKYAADLKQHIERMAEMDIKLEVCQEKNSKLEKEIEEETVQKEEYQNQLLALKKRVMELENLKK